MQCRVALHLSHYTPSLSLQDSLLKLQWEVTVTATRSQGGKLRLTCAGAAKNPLAASLVFKVARLPGKGSKLYCLSGKHANRQCAQSPFLQGRQCPTSAQSPSPTVFMGLFQLCQGPALSPVNFSEWSKDKLVWVPNSVVHLALKTGSSVAAKALSTIYSTFFKIFENKIQLFDILSIFI